MNAFLTTKELFQTCNQSMHTECLLDNKGIGVTTALLLVFDWSNDSTILVLEFHWIRVEPISVKRVKPL